MRVLVLLNPRMIACDARLGFQDHVSLVHLWLGTVACGVRAVAMLQSSTCDGFAVQTDLMTVVKCRLKRVPSHPNALEEMGGSCYRV